MHEENNLGGYFSRNYARVLGQSNDSAKMRFRIAKYLEKYSADGSTEFGKFIETELGIKSVSHGHSSYVNWEALLTKCPVSDFLDILTAICRFRSTRTIREGRISVKYDFRAFVDRVFREEKIAYRIDEKGGVHPFVDAGFTAEVSELVRGLSDEELVAARSHVEKAEMALISHSFDGRQAVRSAFDAAENIFKLLCPNCNQLNNRNIENVLRNILVETLSASDHEKLAAQKLVDSFKTWVEAGHFYRHEPGHPEPQTPSTTFAILYVSQCLGYVRWLAKVYSVLNEP